MNTPEHHQIDPFEISIGDKTHLFDITDPEIPGWIENQKITSDDYPYDKRMKRKPYQQCLEELQIELVKLQHWLQASANRVVAVFEGRDAAGKGGTIKVITEYMNPRHARVVALTKPTERELGQWYFQRYVEHLPTSGEFVAFDRSWYNRAVVEPVMGFCSEDAHEQFLDEVPVFEKLLVRDGIHFFKFWLNIGRETQLKRFHDRLHSPLRNWKFSPMDVAGIGKWEDYTRFRDKMLDRTSTKWAPWTVIKSNDKRRARIAAIRKILLGIPYEGRDLEKIGEQDPLIVEEFIR